MAARRPRVLLGRAAEQELLDRLVASVRDGQSDVLVIRGEAGVGKTALLRRCERNAPGCRVAAIAGIESEMELPFAGLHQLCAPLLGRLDTLPEPQRAALCVAFGLSGGDPPDRFLVALAALSLLAEAGAERPLVCLVDDAHWLDAASAQVLGFVARRLLAESVGMVFAVRDPAEAPELAGLPELTLHGLPEEDARALLATVVPGRIDDRVRDRLVAETRGNPLAILELSAPDHAPGAFELLEPQALPSRIEESFLRRLVDLPAETQTLLLVAAAEPLGDPALMWRAAALLGVAGSALAPAVRTGLLAVGGQVRFLHPLVRSAVYRAAPEGDRCRVHGALADATDATMEPDRRAWHRAQAARATDDEVADELERSADRAQARGGIAAAAVFLGRAADLTSDPGRSAARTLAAAEANLHAGRFDAALGLLAAAQAGPLDALGHARMDLLLAQIAYAQNRGCVAPQLLLRAARTLEPLDVRLARETHLDAWSAALFAGRLANSGGGLLEVSRAARAAPDAPAPHRACDLLLDGFALLFTDGRGAAVPVLQRAATAFAGTAVSVEEVLRWGWLATAAAVVAWDFDTCRTVAGRGAQLARDSGALEVLAVSLNVYAQAVTLGGDFQRAARLIAEARAVRDATGTQVAPYGALVHAAYHGQEAEALPLIERTIEDATAGGQGTAVQYARWARAVHMNAAGRYDEALAAAREASDDTPELFLATWALSERVEAAARTGDGADAASALTRLSEETRGCRESDWARGIEARCRAVLADGDAAEPLYREAIERLERTRLGPEPARARLLYGEWLRRANRRVDAREQLRRAHDTFAAMGASAFAERARHELLATGAKVRKRIDETRDALTPQEAHIAQLARDGRTNTEIGAELYISPRTVEWHLRKVFGKLGISSRRQLRTAMQDGRGLAAAPV